MSYINFIQPSLEFTVSFLFTEHRDGFLFEKFIVQSMNLLKALIQQYKISNRAEHPKSLGILEANRIKTEFFQPNILAIVCRKLITHYFLLTREDLELWDSDPEGFGTVIYRSHNITTCSSLKLFGSDWISDSLIDNFENFMSNLWEIITITIFNLSKNICLLNTVIVAEQD